MDFFTYCEGHWQYLVTIAGVTRNFVLKPAVESPPEPESALDDLRRLRAQWPLDEDPEKA